MNKARNSFMLLITALIWGVAFAMQSEAADYMGAFTFNGIRFMLGFLVLLPVIAFMDSKRPPELRPKNFWKPDKALLKYGLICGVLLCAASNLQQFGIESTTVGKAGFITTFYIVLVPVLGLFFKRRCPPIVWVGMVCALVGLYLLCIKDGFSLGRGDLLILLCSLVFSFHILAIDEFSPKVDCVRLSCLQFLASGIISLILMAIFEAPRLHDILSAWKYIVYSGVLSCGGAYTLQIVGQKNFNPTVASLILSLESVISALAGWLLLRQALSPRELLGCAIVFCAVLMVEIIPPITEKHKMKTAAINKA